MLADVDRAGLDQRLEVDEEALARVVVELAALHLDDACHVSAGRLDVELVPVRGEVRVLRGHLHAGVRLGEQVGHAVRLLDPLSGAPVGQADVAGVALPARALRAGGVPPTEVPPEQALDQP